MGWVRKGPAGDYRVPGDLEGLVGTDTPTPGWGGACCLHPSRTPDQEAGASSSEPGLGARGSSWGPAKAPSPQLVQTGLGRVRPRPAAFQKSGLLPAPRSPQEPGTWGWVLGHELGTLRGQEIFKNPIFCFKSLIWPPMGVPG